MPISCECCVLSGTDRCDGPIPSPGESYRACVFVLECGHIQKLRSTSTISGKKEIRIRKEERKRKNTWLDTLRIPIFNIAPKLIITDVALINVGAQQIMFLKCRCVACCPMLFASVTSSENHLAHPRPNQISMKAILRTCTKDSRNYSSIYVQHTASVV